MARAGAAATATAPAPSAQIPLLRVVVLGPSRSGKTALVDRFVNNHFSPQHAETAVPALYYRVVRPTSEEEGADTVLLEIEDTPPPHFSPVTERERRAGAAAVPLAFFMDLEPTARRRSRRRRGPAQPFAEFPAPVSPVAPERIVYAPLGKGRMGFIVTFDANDLSSCEEALAIAKSLLDRFAALPPVAPRPHVTLCVCKTDTGTTAVGKESPAILLAERFAQEHAVQLQKASAKLNRGVRAVFREMLRLISANPALWAASDEEEGSGSGSEGEEGSSSDEEESEEDDGDEGSSDSSDSSDDG